ncbi:UDP-glycosyltransferase [Melia azedarach]|uniref:UDP-glycosyltransferase n=1 Tax=Melia azedarach TaxID=155640 RepID=A0ACC1YRM5_MELAZ|nr:UDP-glycosyltransferase [Melia azedarach]
MEKQEGKCRLLVLVPCPFQGHINPMLQLGTILHSKGFSIAIAHTKFSFPDTTNHPDFIFLSLLDGSSYKLEDDFIAFMSNLNSNCRAPLQHVLTRIMREQEQHEALPCIIYDALMYFAEAVACHLKLPSLILHTGGAANSLTLLRISSPARGRLHSFARF